MFLLKRLCLLFAFVVFCDSSYAFDDYIRKLIISKKVSKINLLGDIDYRNNKDRLFHRHYDFGIGVPVGDGSWSVAFKYRNVYRKDNGRWSLFEKRPQIQVKNLYKTPWVHLMTRIRQEYRIWRGGDESRTRLLFLLGSAKEFLKLKPFASNEFFYDYIDRRYNRNRIEVGARLPRLIGHYEPEIAYRINSVYNNEVHRWNQEDYVIVFKLRVYF